MKLRDCEFEESLWHYRIEMCGRCMVTDFLTAGVCSNGHVEEFKFVRERSCVIVNYSKVEDVMSSCQIFKGKTARERFDSCGFFEVPTSEMRECSEPSFSCRGGEE